MRVSLQLSLVYLAGIFLSLLATCSASEQIGLNETLFQGPQDVAPSPTRYFTARSEADHRNDLNTLPASGWRLISLSVYGIPPNHLYATVWVRRPGPRQQTTTALEGPAFNNWWFYWTGQGYVPIITSATGRVPVQPDGTEDLTEIVYVAILEKINVFTWTAIWDQTQVDFDTLSANAFATKQKMVSFGQYGRLENPRFCAVMHHNPNSDPWVYFKAQWSPLAEETLRAQTTKPSWRPIYLSSFGVTLVVGRAFELSSLYTDTHVGSWTVKLFQTAAQIAAEDARQSTQNRQLIHLTGGLDGEHSAIWAERESPSPREFHATGPPATGFRNNPSAMATVDGIVKTFMQDTGVREVQVALGKTGNILLERAYTWSEPGRHIIQPSDKFEIASLSKMFCAAAIQSLIDTGQLSLTTKPFNGGLGPGDPWVGPYADRRYLDITIDHLLNHQAGWNRAVSLVDWEFRMIQISRFWGLSRPPNLFEFVLFLRFAVGLDFSPGQDTAYSNLGYIILSQVVETVTGLPYFEYLKRAVLVPMSLGSSVEIFKTDPFFHTSDAVTPQSSNWGPNVQTPQLVDNQVASVFGGDGAFRETALGASFLMCSARTLVKFITTHGELP
jgi:CubicO group peptidase (beta-lactamase class C family)